MRYFIIVLLGVLLLLSPTSARTQHFVETQLDPDALEYIQQYRDLAINLMRSTGIPASIKLGQALLESDKGNSRLATLANNHFGAKCHNSWFGPSISHDDDALGECFRKYNNVEESFNDHTVVLAKERYASLFYLSKFDFKGWATGLKKAGYATDPNYANKLVRIIEKYQLYAYDYSHLYRDATLVYENGLPVYQFSVQTIAPLHDFEKIEASRTTQAVLEEKEVGIQPEVLVEKRVKRHFRIPYVSYEKPVSAFSVSLVYGVTLTELMEINHVSAEYVFQADEKIYLKKLNRRALRPYNKHIVKRGEEMRNIASQYAVQVPSLYELNKMIPGTEPAVGETIHLRNEAVLPPAVVAIIRNVEDINKNLFVDMNHIPQQEKPNELHQVLLDGMHLYDLKAVGRPLVISQTNETVETSKFKNSSKLSKHAGVTPKVSVEKQPSKPQFHIVQKGDTLWGISKQYDISIGQLRDWNNLNNDRIYPGKKIFIGM